MLSRSPRARCPRARGRGRGRVRIARALANKPALLIADEPTGELDSATGGRVMDLFEELNRAGTAILMVTHDVDVASRARRVVYMRDGRVERIAVRGAAAARRTPP